MSLYLLSISFSLFLSLLCLSLAFISFLDCEVYVLVPQPGIQPRPSTVRPLSPNHWATREFPCLLFLAWFFTLPTKQHTLCGSWWGEGVQSSNLHLWSVNYFPIFSKRVSLNSTVICCNFFMSLFQALTSCPLPRRLYSCILRLHWFGNSACDSSHSLSRAPARPSGNSRHFSAFPSAAIRPFSVFCSPSAFLRKKENRKKVNLFLRKDWSADQVVCESNRRWGGVDGELGVGSIIRSK